MKIFIFTFFPLLIGIIILAISILFDKPIEINQISWLFLYGQVLFLAMGTVVILLNKKTEKALPQWRTVANKWVGKGMALFALFYLIAFIIISK